MNIEYCGVKYVWECSFLTFTLDSGVQSQLKNKLKKSVEKLHNIRLAWSTKKKKQHHKEDKQSTFLVLKHYCLPLILNFFEGLFRRNPLYWIIKAQISFVIHVIILLSCLFPYLIFFSFFHRMLKKGKNILKERLIT